MQHSTTYNSTRHIFHWADSVDDVTEVVTSQLGLHHEGSKFKELKECRCIVGMDMQNRKPFHTHGSHFNLIAFLRFFRL